MRVETADFSVIMTVYDNASELTNNLPAFTTQDHPSYEVIVVDESSTDETEDVLKMFKASHPHLYTTFLPKPDRHVIRKKLALTIGVKAAKSEWVIISDIHKAPSSADWLKEIAENLDNRAEITLGYFTKQDMRLQSFSELGQARCHLLKAERKGKDGHKGRYMRYLRGKYDFVIARKDKAHDVLKYFEQKTSWHELAGLRLKILLQNIF